MKPAATLATFVSVRPVQGRKVYQLVMEVAMEQANEAVQALGGLPQSDDPRWVGIALVHKESAAPSADAGPSIATPAEASPEEGKGGAPKPKRHFSELPRSVQAAMLGENPVFQNWITRTYSVAIYGNPPMGEVAAQIVRHQCGVTSRSMLDKDGLAAGAWDRIHARYQAETNQMAEQRA